MKTWILMFTFCAIAGLFGSIGLMRYAEAQGTAAVDAGVAPPAESPDGLSTSPTIASATGVDWNPMHWDWPWIFGTVATLLGAFVMLLRPIALATKWTGDNWLLERLEYVLAMMLRVVVPKGYPKFPDEKVATSSGGKTGGAV